MIGLAASSVHTLSLKSLEEDEARLRTFLADVRNLRWIRSRALRLRVWTKLSLLERSIVSTVIRTLTRVRSPLLLASLVKIAKKLLPHLYTLFERKILYYMELIKERMSRLAEESGSAFIWSLASDPSYLYAQALKIASTEHLYNAIGALDE